MTSAAFASTGLPSAYGLSSFGESHNPSSFDSVSQALLVENYRAWPSTGGGQMGAGSTILIRKLARNMTERELRSMFLFAKDFIDSDFLPHELADDQRYASAVARFKTSAAAAEAKLMLDGKPNTSTEANMIVEILPGSGVMMGPNLGRRNTVDGTLTGGLTSAASAASLLAAAGALSNGRPASRFNSTFQARDRISSPVGSGAGGRGGSNGGINGVSTSMSSEFPFPEASSRIQSLFTPQSPVGNQASEAQPRVTGKSVINDDTVDDDETGELLKDPLAYAQNGHAAASAAAKARRQTSAQVPVSRFAGLSLSTTSVSAASSVPAYAPARTGVSAQPSLPTTLSSPVLMNNAGPGSAYPLAATGAAASHFQRPTYPPVNPADQNPPCNTLYVGNLPIDTSEDELKAMFSKQRGYKRLCFRTKQNGPMCFVEFEDVSFATKALNELYGHPLHNSVKGGIRLSFSKNPLGVRTGQTTAGPGLPAAMNAHGASQALKSGSGSNGNGIGGMSTTSFMSACGPPPGLALPPGLQAPANSPATSMGPVGSPVSTGLTNSVYPAATQAGMRSASFASGISAGTGGSGLNGVSSAFADYMMGR
jgi:hypothetical protein